MHLQILLEMLIKAYSNASLCILLIHTYLNTQKWQPLRLLSLFLSLSKPFSIYSSNLSHYKDIRKPNEDIARLSSLVLCIRLRARK